MIQDILWKTDQLIFSYRVGGILIHNGHILLQRPSNSDYSTVGGHVSPLETTEQTLVREFQEELHADIQVGRLLAIGENFFPVGSLPCHQLCLYYTVHLKSPSQIPLSGVFQGYDELDGQRVDLDFCWIPLDRLGKEAVSPPELVPIILENIPFPVHFVSNQLSSLKKGG